MLETILNKYAHLTTRIDITYPFAQLCPFSGEPQPSSTIAIGYEARGLLLETKALRKYLETYAGENIHGVQDLEETIQVIAQDCANALAVQVVVHAYFKLMVGAMEVKVTAVPN